MNDDLPIKPMAIDDIPIRPMAIDDNLIKPIDEDLPIKPMTGDLPIIPMEDDQVIKAIDENSQPLPTDEETSVKPMTGPLSELPTSDQTLPSSDETVVIPETVDNRPLSERLLDKNWKTRLTAYEELKAKIENSPGEFQGAAADSFFAEFASNLPKLTADSNAGALDAGLDAAIAFVDKAPVALSMQYSDKVFANVVDKAFSARPSTQSKGKTLIIKLMEVDDCTACCQFLLTKLTDKKPKIPPTCIEVIKDALSLFGIRALPVKEIMKALPVVFNGTNGPAREASMALIVEIYRWIGLAPLQALLDSLRTAQKSDFEKIIADRASEFTANPVKPSLYLRKDRAAALAAESTAAEQNSNAAIVNGSGSSSSGGSNAAAASSAIDAREFVEEVDLNKKLKTTDFNALVSQEKWSEQLKGLQLVIDAIGPTPKLKSGTDVYDIVQTCKGFLRQGHLQLQLASLKILQLLADGLRQEFGSTLRPLMQQVIMKSKEKRLVSDVQGTLTIAFAHCFSFDPCAEDIFEVIRSKKSPPHSKVGMIEIISSTLRDFPEKIGADVLKPMAEVLVADAEDSDVKVREACLQALLALSPVVKVKGRQAADAMKLLAGLEQSAPKVFKKLQVAAEPTAASSKPSAAASPPRKEASTSSRAAPGSPAGNKAAAVSKSTSSLPAVSSKTSAASTAGSKKSSTSAAANNEQDDNAEDLTMTVEEAEEALAAMSITGWAEGTLQKAMVSAKWQDKVDALSAIERRLSDTNEGGKYSAALVKYLAATSNSFKISNISVLKATIQTCCAIAQHAGNDSFNRAAAWELIRNFGDKLSDKKTKDLVCTLLSSLVECLGAPFVLKRMRSVMDRTKAPLAHQHYLEWIKQAVVEFGCGCFPVQLLAAFCQLEMDNKNAAVRTAAVEVMGALHFQIGPKLQTFAYSDDMKPQTRALIEAEFSKVGHDPATAAANFAGKVPAGGAAGKGISGATLAAVAGSADPLGFDIPRQDLCSMLDKNILAELNCTEGKTSWQRRKAAMEAIISACERSGHNLDSNKATGELMKALKPRMCDTQANLKPVAAAAIGSVIASLDPETSAVKVLRVMGQSLLTGLADNKKPMRDSTVAALQNAVTSHGDGENAPAHSGMLMVLLPAMTESLVNVVGRQELLAWLSKHLIALKGDCSEIVSSLVLCLQDKSSAVRALSEDVLLHLMASGQLVSRSCFDKATRDLAPATKRAMQPVIDRLFAAYGTAKEMNSKADSEPLPQQQQQQSTEATRSRPADSATASVQRGSSVGMPPPSAAAANAVLRGGGGNGSKAAAMAAAHAAVSSVEEGIFGRAPSSDSQLSNSSAAGGGAANSNSVERTPGGTARWDLKRCAAGRTRKMDEFQKHGWPQPPIDPGEDEMRALRAVWEPLMTNDLVYLLFPKTTAAPANQAVYVPGMLQLTPQLQCPYFSQHVELVLKWCCVLLCLKQESTHGLEELLKFVCAVFRAVQENASGGSGNMGLGMLSESELFSIVPHLVDKAGHRYERQQALFKAAINAAADVTAPNKITQILIASGLKSNNKRSRCVALELIDQMVQSSGVVALGQHGVRDVAAFLDGHDVDIVSRNVCLEVLYSVYSAVGCDFNKLKRAFGSHVSEKSQILLEEFVLNRAAKEFGNDGEPQQQLVVSSASDDMWATGALSAEQSSINCSDHNSSSNGSSGNRLLMTEYSDDDNNVALVAANSPLPSVRKQNRNSTFSSSATDAIATGAGKYNSMSGVEEMQLHRNMLQEIDNIIASTPRAIRSFTSVDSTDGTEGSSLPHLHRGLSEQRHKENATAVAAVASVAESPAVATTSNDTPAIAEMEIVYRDIEEKIDTLLAVPHSVADSDLRYEEAKDYLKMLHSIVNGDWSAEQVPEDELLILKKSESITLRLLRCIARAFDKPATFTGLHATPDASIGVDVSLLAISLSTLFALLIHEGVVQHMSRSTMFEVFHVCLHRICDVRITHPAASSSSSSSSFHSTGNGSDEVDSGKECETTAAQVIHALNMVLVKISRDGSVDAVLGCLIRVLFCCLPPADLSHHADFRPLPASSTKPTSKLVVTILGDRTRLQDPYPEQLLDLQQLLFDIHDFLSRYPRSTPDDTAYRTVKTILNELVQAKGGERILQLLQQQEELIKRTELVYTLTCRLGRVDMVESVDPQLHQSIIAVIEEITSSRDKVAAIKELHRIKKSNPQLDLNVYLLKISTAFRRYVLNTLSRLETNDENTENQPTAAQTNRTSTPQSAAATGAASTSGDHLRKPVVPDTAVSASLPPQIPAAATTTSTTAPAASVHTASMKPKSSAEEALRILEGLKSRPQQKSMHSAAVDGFERQRNAGLRLPEAESTNGELEVPQSPFAQTSAKIRSSLSTLTASLDLPPPVKSSAGATSAFKVVPTAAAVVEGALSLEERIRRLKNQSASAGFSGRA